MDTRLKKMHKKTKLIIALIILMPALILTSLYPKMESEYKALKEEYEQLDRQPHYLENEYNLAYNFVNYVTEAIYVQYADMLQEYQGNEIKTDVLEEYNWTYDKEYVEDNTEYYIRFQRENYTEERKNTEKDLSRFMNDLMSVEELRAYGEEGYLGYFTVVFDQYGKIKDVTLNSFPGSTLRIEHRDLHSAIRASIKQYENNVFIYNETNATSINGREILPKDVEAVFIISEDSEFTLPMNYGDGMYYGVETLYLEIGALYIILFMLLLVGLAALVLPLIRPLETGWERIFSLPLEIMATVTVFTGGALVLMWNMMLESRKDLVEQVLIDNNAVGFQILGWTISPEIVYAIMLLANFIGWSICFFMEYVVVTHFRQFLCSPKYYLKNRLLIVSIVKFFRRQGQRFYDWVCAIDITEKLNRSIVKIVLVNFAILTLLCCMWFLGIAGLVLYSIGLYVFLRKYGEKVQKHYQNVWNAMHEMAEGNLKVKIEEEVGIFEPLSKELERVQEGFAKAVQEEAKSQNMKTELITNVSHDLKTPLTAIITYVDLLKQEGITEEQRRSYIETLDQKSQRLKVLIEDLFEVSKANSGNVKMNFMDVDVVNLMKQVRLEMEDKIMDSNLTFRWNLPDEKVILWLDGKRTYRVFENLLSNILKYAMPESRVYVDVQSFDDKVQIMFRNVSASEIDVHAEQLTERFVRGDVSRNSDGSGLGLAIVKSFVELQNGIFKIEVDGDLFKAIIIWNK